MERVGRRELVQEVRDPTGFCMRLKSVIRRILRIVGQILRCQWSQIGRVRDGSGVRDGAVDAHLRRKYQIEAATVRRLHASVVSVRETRTLNLEEDAPLDPSPLLQVGFREQGRFNPFSLRVAVKLPSFQLDRFPKAAQIPGSDLYLLVYQAAGVHYRVGVQIPQITGRAQIGMFDPKNDEPQYNREIPRERYQLHTVAPEADSATIVWSDSGKPLEFKFGCLSGRPFLAHVLVFPQFQNKSVCEGAKLDDLRVIHMTDSVKELFQFPIATAR